MSNGNCPVPAPKLLKAESTVETCASCGAWVQRYPTFMGDDDSFWQCDKCGSTSVKLRKGRDYGPKSKHWAWVNKQFQELYLDIFPGDRDTVVTEPPMSALDWQAVEAWFRSHNIYRSFIAVTAEVVTEGGA